MRDYRPVNFHFQVEFLNLPGSTPEDIKFQSVTGLSVDFTAENVKEGGENRFEHVVPVRTKYPELVLKRGLYLPGESGLTGWCADAFDKFIFQPVNLVVQLLNERHQALAAWDVTHALPKSWEFGELNAEDGKVLIETFKLSYNYFRFKKL
jgi:phage tail-like protein